MAWQKRQKQVAGWLITLLLIGGGVFTLRLFAVASFRISTGAMEAALLKGDRVIVNKLPLPNNPGRNRAVLFYSPLERDTLNRPLFASRCVGIPGDTIRVGNEGYEINGRAFPYSPNFQRTYFVAQGLKEKFTELAKRLNIPLRDPRQEPFGLLVDLTSFEEYQIREELEPSERKQFTPQKIEEYTLIVPQKERSYPLTPSNLRACQEIIRKTIGNKAVIRDDKLYVDGKETYFLFPDQDYYWVLSDNTNESVDSRHLGFIPADHMVGNIVFCWYSKDKRHLLKPIH